MQGVPSATVISKPVLSLTDNTVTYELFPESERIG